MTDRLSQLLHQEATHIPTPAVPDPARLAHDGRRLRRRRQVTNGVAVAASVALLAAGGVLLTLVNRGDSEPQPVDVDPDAIVWAYDSDVHLDDVTARVPGTVLSLDPTSAGVLALSTTESAPLAGPGRLTLVRYDGTTQDLGELEAGAAPATDPHRDFYVLSELRGTDRWVVVRDAESGEIRDEFDVPGSTSGRQPMSLDGDTLYVPSQQQLLMLDLTSGDFAEAPKSVIYYGGGTAGRAITGDRRRFQVVDVDTGDELMRFPTAGGLIDAELSPGGRSLRVVRGDSPRTPTVEPRTLRVYEVATGAGVRVDIGDADASTVGWTLSSDLYTLTGTGVLRCEAPEWRCRETGLDDLPDLPEPFLDSEPLAQIVLPGRL